MNRIELFEDIDNDQRKPIPPGKGLVCGYHNCDVRKQTGDLVYWSRNKCTWLCSKLCLMQHDIFAGRQV